MTRPSVESSPDAREPHHQMAVAVDRAAEDLAAGLHLDRNQFAGDRCGIDAGRAGMDQAVGRNEIAGAQIDQVADAQRLGSHLFDLAARQQAARLDLGQLAQRPDGFLRARAASVPPGCVQAS